SAVFLRSCSSESALIVGSRAFTSATIGRRRFSSRSFWVPTTLARSVSSIRAVGTGVSNDCNAQGRRAEGRKAGTHGRKAARQECKAARQRQHCHPALRP